MSDSLVEVVPVIVAKRSSFAANSADRRLPVGHGATSRAASQDSGTLRREALPPGDATAAQPPAPIPPMHLRPRGTMPLPTIPGAFP